MKQINLIFTVGVVLAVVFYKIATRKTGAAASQTGGTPAATLGASVNTQIDEAAYNQEPSDFAAATGADENTSGEEVISYQ